MQESEGVLCMRVSFRIALAGQVIGVSALYGRHEICRPGAVYPPHDVEGAGAYYKLYHFYYYGLQRPVLLLL